MQSELTKISDAALAHHLRMHASVGGDELAIYAREAARRLEQPKYEAVWPCASPSCDNLRSSSDECAGRGCTSTDCPASPQPRNLLGDSLAEALPQDGCYIIQFDDQDRRSEFFAMHGARDAALARYKQISTSWNAHLFVKIDSNSRDVQSPSAALTLVRKAESPAATYQARVLEWLIACFGHVVANDATQRRHRFLEEALELVQSCGGTRSEAIQLVDYIFSRPIGEKRQEVGGVFVTFAALCLAHRIDMYRAGEDELARNWANKDKIRAKADAKPNHSPLPGPSSTPAIDLQAEAKQDLHSETQQRRLDP